LREVVLAPGLGVVRGLPPPEFGLGVVVDAPPPPPPPPVSERWPLMSRLP
jgi:hypothetical protein